MGSSGEDALAAYLQCQREPWSHRCEPTMFGDELPPRVITLSAYWIDRTEVTIGQYAACVKASACRPALELPLDGDPRRPVERVTWDEAVACCRFRGGRLL